MKTTREMDFLVGGMPRGGTTALSVVFNLHPSSFCYAAETHFIPLLMEFGQYAPVPSGSLPGIKMILESQNHQVLLEMPQDSVKSGASDRWVIFDAADVALLNKAIMELLEQGFYGQQLCKEAMRLVAGIIRRKTGKDIAGEKTPSNVFGFKEYGAAGSKLAIVLLREPFSVIRSMRKRGADETDKYNKPFQGELLELIGLYSSYVDAILEARQRADVMVVKYEDLLQSSADIIRTMFTRVGLLQNDRAVELGVKSLKLRSGGAPWEAFAPSERALVWHMTAHLRERAGYTEEFYAARGLTLTDQEKDISCDEALAVPIFGHYPKAASEGGVWLNKESCLAIQVPAGKSVLQLKFWSEFPEFVLGDGQQAEIRAIPLAGIGEAGSAKAGRKAVFTTLDIKLKDLPPVYSGKSGSLYLVKLQSSHAYRRTVTPMSRLGTFFFGGDRRELAFCLVESKFS